MLGPRGTRTYLRKSELVCEESLHQSAVVNTPSSPPAPSALDMHWARLQELMGCCSCHSVLLPARIFRQFLQVNGGVGL